MSSLDPTHHLRISEFLSEPKYSKVDEGKDLVINIGAKSVFSHYGHIPKEMEVKIFSYLDAESLCNVSQVSRSCQQIAYRDDLWKHLFIREKPHSDEKPVDRAWKEHYAIKLQLNYRIQEAYSEGMTHGGQWHKRFTYPVLPILVVTMVCLFPNPIKVMENRDLWQSFNSTRAYEECVVSNNVTCQQQVNNYRLQLYNAAYPTSDSVEKAGLVSILLMSITSSFMIGFNGILAGRYLDSPYPQKQRLFSVAIGTTAVAVGIIGKVIGFNISGPMLISSGGLLVAQGLLSNHRLSNLCGAINGTIRSLGIRFFAGCRRCGSSSLRLFNC